MVKVTIGFDIGFLSFFQRDEVFVPFEFVLICFAFPSQNSYTYSSLNLQFRKEERVEKCFI